ncbi:MAG: ABC transporter permease, partial [Actinomycetota bacterium]|nr:ABC transporter permease [Actinomycetota bacterium]
TSEFSVSALYVPGIAAFSVITACYTNIAISISFSRDTGILKKIHGTPLPGWAYVLARVVHASVIAVILVAIVAVFGRAFYDVDFPSGASLLRFVVILVVGAASFSAMGLAITTVIPNADASPAIVNASILPLLFLSGVFIPITNSTPEWVSTVSKIFPIRHFVDAMNAGFLGTPFSWTDVWLVAAWGLAGLIVAARFFSWEPRT